MDDVLIEIEAKFPQYLFALTISIDVSNGTFLYQMIVQETNLK